jgi:hypothetical protein
LKAKAVVQRYTHQKQYHTHPWHLESCVSDLQATLRWQQQQHSSSSSSTVQAVAMSGQQNKYRNNSLIAHLARAVCWHQALRGWS